MATLIGCVREESDPLSYDDLLRFEGLDRRSVLVAQEDRIAECMAEKGFEYIPYVPSSGEVGLFPVETLAEIPVPEYASVHGYGFADSVERARNAASQDPNLAIRNSLGPSEVGAYFAALVGADPSDPNSEPGCSQASADPGYFSYLDSRRELIDEWKAQLFSDTRYLELEGTWSACMGDAGFSIPTRIQGVIEYFEPEMQALSPQPAESEIRDLRALEIEVALQDLECLQAIESKLRVLAAEHEAELLDQSGDLRSQLRELQRRYGP